VLLDPRVLAAPREDFLRHNCYDCHADGAAEGGLDLEKLTSDLSDPAVFSTWERIFDRVRTGEMPPAEMPRPNPASQEIFLKELEARLFAAHAKVKGTVLRRLNRQEYQNTMNDTFGTHLDLAEMLPEDSRSGEFDNVGESLGLSMVHLQRYMDAARLVVEAAISKTTEKPKTHQISAGYLESREGEKFIGKIWKALPDGAVVRFSSGGYPSGMIRGTSVPESGRYRIRVRGYAYQSAAPITFSVGGTSFARGSEKPIFGFWSFPPKEASDSQSSGMTAEHTIEFEAWLDKRYMLTIEPYGINDPQRYKRESIKDYDGPGLAILDVQLQGPLIEQWPTKGHQLLFAGLERREKPPQNPALKNKPWYEPEFEILTEDETQDIQHALTRVLKVAFRQPPTAQDVVRYMHLFSERRSDGESIEQALRTTVAAIFCSPKFLYLQESPGQLDDYALASRLSYFLSRTAPDPQLLSLAAAGELSQPAVLRDEAERLMRTPEFERFLIDFSDNWLDLRDIDFTAPDQKLFPEFDSYLRFSMPLETRAFLAEMINENLPVRNLVDSDFAMLNSRLAEHYELPSVQGAEVRRVALPEGSSRGGLLTQASILKVTANGTNTSPVTRGAWVMERLLNAPPPPPPPGIAGVEPDIRGSSTLREILEKHRSSETCNACHEKIDPAGFALESFNPIGGYREYYRSLGAGERVDKLVGGRQVRYRIGPAVDSSGELPGKGHFDSFEQFKLLMADDERQLARAFVVKLLTFATGREMGFSDRTMIEGILTSASGDNFRIRDLVHQVVQSSIFRTK
jgi:hypothetical protein